jgi:hypothetical protein
MTDLDGDIAVVSASDGLAVVTEGGLGFGAAWTVNASALF